MVTRPVVVGVDGSEESLQAVEWAAQEAGRHSWALRIVSAPAAIPRIRAFHAAADTVAIALRGISERAIEAAVSRSREVAPGLRVSTGLLSGPAALAVADSGADAAMLVVGARGAGGFTAMILGSVSRYAATRAPCPVVVVRQETMAIHREIAVGIRDPDEVDGTLAFAFEEAAQRGANLVAVHAWHWFPSVLRRAGVGAGADLGRGRPHPGRGPGRVAGQVPLGAGQDRRHPRASGPGPGQLLRPRRPGGARQARRSRRSRRCERRRRHDPARGPRSRARPGRRRPRSRPLMLQLPSDAKET